MKRAESETGTALVQADRHGDVEARFFGKGLPRPATEAARWLVSEGVELGWAEQVHGAVALPGVPGCAGPADGLVTGRRGLALAIVTADCVPVLFATESRIGAAHAGWRGIVAGILSRTVEQLAEPPEMAWIGPSIGLDAYEVSPEVAARIAAASTPSVVRERAGQRPHVDLAAAAEWQLRQAGVREVRHVRHCTFEDPRLWSYRRDGAESGRNYSVIWRRSDR